MTVTAAYARASSRHPWRLVGTVDYYTTEHPDPKKVELEERAEAEARRLFRDTPSAEGACAWAIVQPLDSIQVARALDGRRGSLKINR